MGPKGNFETQVIHAGEPTPRIHGAVVSPIFQSSTFEYEFGKEIVYDDIKYIRLNNTPNQIALHEKLAFLESGEAALVAASGMSAISATLLAFLKAGDHLLVQNNLYGATNTFVTEDLTALGISFDFIDASQPASWETKIKPTTKIIYGETLSNPLLEIPDFSSVAHFARSKNIKSVIDNTFASPFNFRPLEIGFDLSIHSATKYLNGHSDIVAGAVIGNKADIKAVTHKLSHLGGTLDPHACFLLNRGLKTLAVRLKHQNESALKISEFLSAHPKVIEVRYPGLKSHPQHQRAQEFFDGYGGMISFKVQGGGEAAQKVVETLRIAIHAPSLGGVETLITRPATTTHACLTMEERNRVGITDDLLRLSVGLESTDDLIADLKNALHSL